MKSVIAEAGRLLTPTAHMTKKKKKIAESAIRLVREQAVPYPQVTGVEFGGSYAKNTWLKDRRARPTADVDIFVKFKRDTSEGEFEEISREIGFEAMRDHTPYTRHSQHPFVEAVMCNTRINVVPCYDMRRGPWQSAADRSPHHTRFVQKEFTEKMRREVRLLKTFLLAGDIYGAEIERQGFSGYVCEVLIYHYKSFEAVVGMMADLSDGHKVGTPSKKFGTRLVITDPVDAKRNLAAAISEESVGRMVLRCRAFQSRPSLWFFKFKRPAKAWRHTKNVLTVRFGFRPRSPETIWGQARRMGAALASRLDAEGFNVLRTGSHIGKKYACLFFLLESPRISAMRAKEGPEFYRREHAGQFIKRNIRKSKLMWVGRDRKILSLEEREFTAAAPFLRNVLENGSDCIPKGLRADFVNGFRVFAGAGRAGKSVKEAIRSMVSTDDAFVYSD